MSLKSGGNRKSKNNPEKKCRLCEEKIFNKSRASLYCEDCFKLWKWLGYRVQSIRYHFKKKSSDYKLIIKFKVLKNNNKGE